MIILTVPGDPARSDGRIQPGDQLVEVDGRSLVGLPYLEGVAIIKATSNMATFRVRKRKEGRGDTPNREGDTPNREENTPNREEDTPNREGDTPNREGDTPNREGDTPNREGDTQSPLGREKEQPPMVSVDTPLKREEPRDGIVNTVDVGSPLASGENVATPTQQATPSPEEYTPTQQEATPSSKDELTTPPQMIPPTEDLRVEEKIGKCMWGCILSNIPRVGVYIK